MSGHMVLALVSNQLISLASREQAQKRLEAKACAESMFPIN